LNHVAGSLITVRKSGCRRSSPHPCPDRPYRGARPRREGEAAVRPPRGSAVLRIQHPHRTSFELAAKSLGAVTTLVSDKSSSIEKGESLKDTGLTLRALGAECIILRHPASGSPFVLERATGLPVLNAGDGMHQHPSQALLDLRTIIRRLGLQDRTVDSQLLKDVTITITGDIRHSRVARSNAMLLPRLGAKVLLCGPPALLPEEAASLDESIEIVRDFNAALERSQVAMMLRIQRERLAGLEVDLAGYIADFQLTEERLAAFAPDAVVMHPGP